MQNGLWRCAGLDNAQIRRVAAKYKMPERVARWLLARVDAEEDVLELLKSNHISWTAPDLFEDMGLAVAHIRGCIERKDRIAIVGDYDVDGVTASVILASTLNQLKADWVCLIPHRIVDGYGLTVSLVNRAHALGAKTLVTVDNGIQCVEAVGHAAKLGIAVVVTDHHEPAEERLPDAVAIVHWCRSSTPLLQRLSGAGVAWKLALALTNHGELALEADFLSWIQALACLGALADMMPMVGENRRLVQEGVAALNGLERPGWKTLCEVAGVRVGHLVAADLLWSVTPRINAAGRMGHATVAFDLLLTDNPGVAAELAAEIEALNQLRRGETERAATEAIEKFEADHAQAALPPVLVVAGPWSLGVVGIVAAKLCDRFQRPAIVFADDGGDVLRGSGRAATGVPLHRWVSACAESLEHFGGHETALGCGVQRAKLEEFSRLLLETALRAQSVASDSAGDCQACTGSLYPVADDYLPLSDVQLDVARWVLRLAPFGNEFPVYEFYIGPVKLGGITAMGNGRHLRMTVEEGRESRQLVWFSPPAWAFELEIGTKLAVVASLEINAWQGVERAQLRVRRVFVLHQPLLREDFAVVYRLLKARRKVYRDELAGNLPEWEATQLRTVVDTLVDLGFAYMQESAYHVVEQVTSRDLRESVVYQTHLATVAAAGEHVG